MRVYIKRGNTNYKEKRLIKEVRGCKIYATFYEND